MNRRHHFRRGAPGHAGLDLGGIDLDGPGENGVGVAAQVAPHGDGAGPVRADRGQRTALDIGDGLLIHSHQPRTSARFYGHVAQGHAPFHRQGLNPLPGEFQHESDAPGRADHADDVQDQILRRHAGGQLAGNLD